MSENENRPNQPAGPRGARRTAWQWVRVVGGFAVLAAGVAMLALPGPGWLTIALGLGILAEEFHWARRLLDRLKLTVKALRDRASR